ncbi:type I-F CRISPR-associated endoribonuclease Cas6/Csy4 [Methylomonas sp. MS20]|uniref:type I-F CRISPR-associated endoribonuclease Cas6/Csy4 n=1 Tax=unclassified Methylomonas TaxID=2608980 RepID=UPI003918626F
MAQYSRRRAYRHATPFIRLQSLSNGQSFCLWIGKSAVAAPLAGHFSAYGLSRTATVPEF